MKKKKWRKEKSMRERKRTITNKRGRNEKRREGK